MMSRIKFGVSYEIVTPESSEHGDADERGWIIEATDLRGAIQLAHWTRTNRVDGVTAIETDSSPCVRPRWITVQNGMEFETGANESRTLHIPDSVTTASARRIARLAGVKLS